MSNSAGTLPVSTRVSGLGAKLSGADSDVSLALVDCDELNSACEVLAYTKTKSDAAKAARTQRIQPETRNDNAGAMKGDIELHSIIINTIEIDAEFTTSGILFNRKCGNARGPSLLRLAWPLRQRQNVA